LLPQRCSRSDFIRLFALRIPNRSRGRQNIVDLACGDKDAAVIIAKTQSFTVTSKSPKRATRSASSVRESNRCGPDGDEP
jgi:hypothetical protein